MSSAARKLPDSDAADMPIDVPIAPSIEVWRAMSQVERDRFLEVAMAATLEEQRRLSEGAPHSVPKSVIHQTLRDHFERSGRKVYLRTDMDIVYPGERVRCPDLIAVLDVEDTGLDDRRMAWVVADEGRGIDLALEVNHHGNRQKDLFTNVVDYARMQIPEYFVYDRLKERILGYRLPTTFATRYEPVPSRGGFLASRVLGLDFAIVGGHLRVFYSGAQIPETRELLHRVSAMVEGLEARAEEEAERANAESARAKAEAERAQAESARADAEAAARAALELKVAELMAKLERSS